MTFEHERQRVNRIAVEAIQKIKALELPLDPANFELWFTCCARTNGELNSAVKALLAAGAKPTREQWDRLLDQFVSPRRFAEQVRSIGKDLHETANEVAEAIQEASGTTDDYGDELANTLSQLQRTGSEDELKATFVTLLQSTQEIQKTNTLLQQQLSESVNQIRQLQERLDAVQFESMLDPLTKVSNRRLFDESLTRTIMDADAQGEPMSLLLIDVDSFKQFNDQYGHQVGDDVLRLVAAAIKKNCRQGDLVCRYGGDEFTVILPRTSVQGALVVAEKIRFDITQRELLRRSSGEPLGRLTVSIGLAQHQNGRSAGSLIERTDAWLRAAKRNGRDRIEVDDADSATMLHVGGGRSSRRLVWHEAYNCGNAKIDQEHRHLFELANALFDPPIDDEGKPREILMAIDSLISHVTKHFADEEAELLARQFPGLERHRAVHARLSAEAAQMRAGVETGTRTLGDVREFLVNTLVAEHLFKDDREFFPLFQ